MPEASEARSGTQGSLLRELQRHKNGLTIDILAATLGISRNGVRQHLLILERDRLVKRSETRPSGGRPEHVYVLTAAGDELFPRQYSWLLDLLINSLRLEDGGSKLQEWLYKTGQHVGSTMKAQLPGEPGSKEQLTSLAATMSDLGYDATVVSEENGHMIKAQNCVFLKLASQYPHICTFDTSMLASATGCEIEHRSCIVKGGGSCCFSFKKSNPVRVMVI